MGLKLNHCSLKVVRKWYIACWRVRLPYLIESLLGQLDVQLVELTLCLYYSSVLTHCPWTGRAVRPLGIGSALCHHIDL